MTLQATRKNTLEEAQREAWKLSLAHPVLFVYVIHSTRGVYIVDTIFIKHDDEKLIETYKNGILI